MLLLVLFMSHRLKSVCLECGAVLFLSDKSLVGQKMIGHFVMP